MNLILISYNLLLVDKKYFIIILSMKMHRTEFLSKDYSMIKQKVGPRIVPHRDDKYMGLAFIHASFSKDPHTQIGAVIVDSTNHILGTGYNGPPRIINDLAINWDRPEKYMVIEHAEANAIDHSAGPTDGSTLYVTGKPCNGCMIRIVKAGIRRVVYFNHKSQDSNSMFSKNEIEFKNSEETAKLGYVTMQEYKGNLNWMRDRMNILESAGVFN